MRLILALFLCLGCTVSAADAGTSEKTVSATTPATAIASLLGTWICNEGCEQGTNAFLLTFKADGTCLKTDTVETKVTETLYWSISRGKLRVVLRKGKVEGQIVCTQTFQNTDFVVDWGGPAFLGNGPVFLEFHHGCDHSSCSLPQHYFVAVPASSIASMLRHISSERWKRRWDADTRSSGKNEEALLKVITESIEKSRAKANKEKTSSSTTPAR